MAKNKGVPVQATVSPELNEFLESHKWDVKMTRTELVRHALEQYAAANGFTQGADTNLAEAPAADAT